MKLRREQMKLCNCVTASNANILNILHFNI